MTVATADTPEWTAPMTKYGGKTVECQPGRMAMAKSQDTIEWTETKIGRISADSRMPAIVCNRHWRLLPWKPIASRAYSPRRQPLDRSRATARSGISATYTKSVLLVRYVKMALGSQTS